MYNPKGILSSVIGIRSLFQGENRVINRIPALILALTVSAGATAALFGETLSAIALKSVESRHDGATSPLVIAEEGESFVLEDAPDLATVMATNGSSVVLNGSAPELTVVMVSNGSSVAVNGEAPNLTTILVSTGSLFTMNGSFSVTGDNIVVMTDESSSAVLNGEDMHILLAETTLADDYTEE